MSNHEWLKLQFPNFGKNFNSKENDKNISSLKRKLSSFVQPSEQLNIIDDDFNR